MMGTMTTRETSQPKKKMIVLRKRCKVVVIDGSPKTESRHKSNANNYNGQEEIKELKMVNTLVCKHCKNEDIQAVFLPESAEDL